MSNTEQVLQMMFSNYTMTAVFIISLVIGAAILFLVYKMAKDRNREPIAWTLVGLFTTPLLAIILLLVLGEKK